MTVLPGGRSANPAAARADEPASWSDEALVAAFASADPRAPDELWRRYAELVVGSIARMVGPDADTEDLTQEVFLHLFRRLSTLRDASALRSFIYSFVVRIVRAELRRRWVRRIMRPLVGAGERRDDEGGAYGDDGMPLQLSPVLDGAVPAFAARAAVRRLYAIMDTLDSRGRAAYVLRFIEGESLADTAAAVGVSLATVKRQLTRAAAEVNRQIAGDPVLREYLPSAGHEKVELPHDR